MRYANFYSQYLSLPADLKSEGFTDVHCPLHDDRHKSAGIDLNTGVFNCHLCGIMSPAKFLVKLIPNLTLQQAYAVIDEYRRENNLILKTDTFVKTFSYNPRFDLLAKHALEIPLEEVPMAKEYAESRGLTLETLKLHKVGFLYAKDVNPKWNRDSLVFPYYYDERATGIRYRDAEGNKSGEPGCHFMLWGVDDLPGNEHKIGVIVEGESDRLRTQQELGYEDFVVVSTPTSTFRLEWEREFEGFSRISLVPQADEAAQKLVEKAKEALRDRLSIVQLPWKRRQIGKDNCEWLNYNDGDELRVRIESKVGDGSRRLLTGIEFHEKAKVPRKYLVNRLLARRQVAVIAGQPKHKKTWVALNLIRTLLLPGEEFCGIPDLTSTFKKVNILLVEEEGDEEELDERLQATLGNTNWQEQLFVMHHLGVKMDVEHWVEQLEEKIEKHSIDVAIFDPFQRLHSLDENSSSETGIVWEAFHRLTTRFKHFSPVILHHFNKAGDLGTGWNAMRGSSRAAGEADLGIFVERRAKSEGDGIKMKFDGRTLKPLETADGKDIFKLSFENGIFDLDTKRTATIRETIEEGAES